MPHDSPSRDGTDGLLVDSNEFIQYHISCGEHAVGVQESVQKVNRKETEIGQSFQQTFDAGIANLQHFAGVHHLAEADIHIITVQTRIGSICKRTAHKNQKRKGSEQARYTVLNANKIYLTLSSVAL